MPKESNVDKALRLHKQAEAAKKAAIGDLLAERRAIDAKLEQLGYQERAPRGRGRKQAAKKATAPKTAARAAKVCPVCKQPGHDGRRHRWDKKDTAKK
jgi:hypothetical protein